jgi:hypothetical protein
LHKVETWQAQACRAHLDPEKQPKNVERKKAYRAGDVDGSRLVPMHRNLTRNVMNSEDPAEQIAATAINTPIIEKHAFLLCAKESEAELAIACEGWCSAMSHADAAVSMNG